MRRPARTDSTARPTSWSRGLTKPIGMICLVGLMGLALIGCGHEQKIYKIGVAQCSEDSWRAKLNEELRTSTYMYDNVEIEFTSAGDDDNKQIEQINAFVNKGVDLLIVSPNQMNIISDAVDCAYDSGIPVILLDRKTGSGKYTAFIGADNVDIGRDIGEFIAGKLNGQGRVVEIQGLAGSSPAIERHKGFIEAMNRYPGIEIIESRSADWLQSGGKTAMDSVLTRNRDINCVFGHNDRMALGAYESMKEHGLTDSVLFAGIDALPTSDGGIVHVQDGTFGVSCIYPTRGDLVLKLAMDILEGRDFQKENPLKAALVTRDNAYVMLMQAEEIANQNHYLDTLHGKVDTYLTQYNHQKVYLLLSAIIIVLLIIFFVMAYRAILMKRRLIEDTTNAKLVFFTNMSHEFRTPLTLIADPVERMLGDDNLTQRQRERLSLVSRNARLLLRLVSEILEFRRLQNGKMTLTLSRFNLAEYLRQWTDGFRPATEPRGITLTLSTPPDLTICADLYKVERICYNLLSNAVKYSRKGGTVELAATREGKNIHIRVSDNGIGIPRDKAGHVFERFFQVKSNPTGGTGIGLALVKAFTETMHGTVSVESEEGRGSTFTVILPAEQPGCDEEMENIIPDKPAEPAIQMTASEHSTAQNATIQPYTEPGSDRNKTVLIVDDNDDIRAYIASLLSEKYNIIFAADGQEGLEKATQNVPDLIICDVMMPVMDGLEMCRKMKQETATSHIPVLMLTARSLEEQRAEGYDCGADSYLTKPFNGSVLISRVSNLLESRRRLRELFKNISTGHDPETDKAEQATDKGKDNGDGSGNNAADNTETDALAATINSSDMRFINEFRAKVQERMADSDLNVETLSADMGLSRVQFYRKVKALTGSTPVEIIRRSRLERAVHLLHDGAKTVSEVAYEVGFSSPSYFIKCYKDMFGHTPNAK